jgi:hypothetical protein
MAIIVPNTASTFATAGCVVGSDSSNGGKVGAWIWLGLRTPITASGSATFYRTGASTSGSEMLAISLSPGQFAGMFGPFSSPNGVYIAGITGGCAIVWMKE